MDLTEEGQLGYFYNIDGVRVKLPYYAHEQISSRLADFKGPIKESVRRLLVRSFVEFGYYPDVSNVIGFQEEQKYSSDELEDDGLQILIEALENTQRLFENDEVEDDIDMQILPHNEGGLSEDLLKELLGDTPSNLNDDEESADNYSDYQLDSHNSFGEYDSICDSSHSDQDLF